MTSPWSPCQRIGHDLNGACVPAAAKAAPKNRRREIARDAVAAFAGSPPTAPRFEGAEWGADQDGTDDAALEARAFAPGVTSLVDAYFKIRHPGW